MTAGRSQLLIRIWTPNKELIGKKQDEKKCHGERVGKKKTREEIRPLFLFFFFLVLASVVGTIERTWRRYRKRKYEKQSCSENKNE